MTQGSSEYLKLPVKLQFLKVTHTFSLSHASIFSVYYFDLCSILMLTSCPLPSLLTVAKLCSEEKTSLGDMPSFCFAQLTFRSDLTC